MGHEIELDEGQLRLFPLDAPRRVRGQRRIVPTYSDEQRAAFRRSEEIIARIRPKSLAADRKLCAGCGKIIHREGRNCGRRWCPLVHQTWLRDRESVIRRALKAHGGPFLVIAITQTHEPGWWACDGTGHPGVPCSGQRGCRVRTEIAERQNALFPEGRRALLNHTRMQALRAMKRAGYEVSPSACILVQTVEPQSRGLDHGHLVLGHATKVEKAFARFFVDALARFSAEHGLGFVDRYNHALWRQRQYQGVGQAERAARYLSKYVSKERASEWLREKVGQRVFYVAPWLSRAAGASMRIARLGRRMWASDHGYCERPRCTEEELEAVMRFHAARDGPPERAP
jgi:hypothetical protein